MIARARRLGTPARSEFRLIHERGHAALGEILPTALSAPQLLSGSALGIIASALDAGGDDARILALRTLAALAYARPDLVRRSIVGPLARIMAGPVSAPLAMAVAETFQLLATSAAAPPAARALTDLLGRRRLAPAARDALLAALRSYAQWRPHLFPLDAALRAARAAPNGNHRDPILREVIERHVFTTPRLFSDAIVSRLIAGFGDRPRLRDALASLPPRRGFPRAARARVVRWLTKRSTLGPSAVAAVIGQAPRAVLIIHNVADGQGDEIVRITPLVQALLDANPSLTATILSARGSVLTRAPSPGSAGARQARSGASCHRSMSRPE